ncbi:MAG: CoA-binding protein [Thermoanaerobaculia bacterium]|nr:CoA-binding protein [Thermoanaerobaculia bacterium]
MNEPARIREVLETAETVAVVGCSPNPARPSHSITLYLMENGYRVIPVNPGHRQILGERCYRSLSEIPSGERVDVVDVFRRSEYVAAVAEEAIARGVGFFWMQYGITDPEAARKLEEAGIPVAMDRCILVEHGRLGIPARRRNAVDGKNVAFPGRPVGGRGI